MSIEPEAVVVETSLRLVSGPSGVTFRTRLVYNPADPYAVWVKFYDGRSEDPAVVWTFARELLATGLDESAGVGNVRVWPWPTRRGDFVALALASPDGNALFEMPRPALARFLRRAYAVVPRGREAERLDVDAAVARLLEAGHA